MKIVYMSTLVFFLCGYLHSGEISFQSLPKELHRVMFNLKQIDITDLMKYREINVYFNDIINEIPFFQERLEEKRNSACIADVLKGKYLPNLRPSYYIEKYPELFVLFGKLNYNGSFNHRKKYPLCKNFCTFGKNYPDLLKSSYKKENNYLSIATFQSPQKNKICFAYTKQDNNGNYLLNHPALLNIYNDPMVKRIVFSNIAFHPHFLKNYICKLGRDIIFQDKFGVTPVCIIAMEEKCCFKDNALELIKEFTHLGAYQYILDCSQRNPFHSIRLPDSPSCFKYFITEQKYKYGMNRFNKLSDSEKDTFFNTFIKTNYQLCKKIYDKLAHELQKKYEHFFK